jgi:PAS domain S-box-containing protein
LSEDSKTRTQLVEELQSAKQRIESLEQVEKAYETLLDESIAAIAVFRDQRIVYCNKRLSDSIGYSQEEMTSFSFEQIDERIHPEDREELWRQTADKISGNPTPEHTYFRFLHKDGTYRWVDAKAGTITYKNEPALQVSYLDMTDRKENQQALTESEAFLGRLFDESPFPAWISDAEGTLVKINRACCESLEIKEEDVVGKYNILKDNIARDQGCMPMVEKVFATGETVNFQLDYKSSQLESPPLSGTVEKFLDVTISAIKDADGKVVNTIVQHTDITDRVRIESSLRESEMHFRMITDNTPSGIFIHRDFELLYVNPRVAVMLGFETGQEKSVIGKSLLDWVEPEFGDAVREGARLRLAGKIPPRGRYEFQVKKKDGTPIWIEIVVSLIDFQGAPAFIGNVIDITDRKIASEALIASQQRYQSVVDNAMDGIAVVQHQKFRFVNQALADITGFAVDEMLAESFLDIVHPEDRNIVLANYRLRLEGKNPPIPYAIRIVTKEDEIRWLEINAVPFEWKGAPATLSFLHDATKRKVVTEQREQAFTEAQKRLSENKAVLAASRAILRDTEFDVTARRIFDECSSLIGSTAGCVALLPEGGDENEVIFLEAGGGPCTDLPMPIRSLSETAFRQGQSVYENDFVNSAWAQLMPAGQPMIDNVLFTPIAIDEIVVGAIGFANKPGGFTDEDARNASAFGDLAAIALSNFNNRKALTDSEQRLLDITENMFDMVAIADMEGRYEYINRSHFKILGYEPKAVLGKPMYDFIHPEDLQIVAEKIATSLSDLEDFKGELAEVRIRAADGSYRWLETMGTLLFDDNGQPHKMVFSSRDVTERRRQQAELRESQERYKTLFEKTANPIAVIDTKGIYLEANEAFCRFTEVPREELLGTKVSRFHPPDDNGATLKKHAPLWKNGGEVETQYWINGTPKFMELVITPGQWRGEDVVFGFGRDVTEQKIAEKEKGLLQEQLVQSQKMEAIGRLAGGVAHDFNNLLTAIQGFADLAIDSLDESDPVRSDVVEIKNAADSAASLTQQLLAFSRKQIIAPKILNINDIVTRSQKMIRRIIGEDIQPTLNPEANLWKTRVDPGQIDQILVNLAVNARDAMSDGGKLTIETANASVESEFCIHCGKPFSGEYVMLSVEDTGAGMDEQTREKIFEPFFTTKDVGKGTGLGLSTVFGIVVQNEGHINVESELGKGTRFSIYLPAAMGMLTPLGLRPIGGADGGTETILLVEDQEMVRSLARRVLEQKGYEVLEASNGSSAINIIQSHERPIDLILTDVVMPGMNGKDLVDRILEIRPNIKPLFMSGYTEDAIAQHGVLEEGTEFIQKPFRPGELLDKVRRVLDK